MTDSRRYKAQKRVKKIYSKGEKGRMCHHSGKCKTQKKPQMIIERSRGTGVTKKAAGDGERSSLRCKKGTVGEKEGPVLVNQETTVRAETAEPATGGGTEPAPAEKDPREERRQDREKEGVG